MCDFLEVKDFNRGPVAIRTDAMLLALINFIEHRDVLFAGLATTFSFGAPNIELDSERDISVSDLNSILPQALVLSFAEPSVNGFFFYNVLIDLKNTELLPGLAKILALPLVFSGFNLKMSLCCLWQLGLTEPSIIWDCYIYERLQSLGVYNKRYYLNWKDGQFAQIEAEKRAAEEKQFRMSIGQICLEYGVHLQAPVVLDFDPSQYGNQQLTAVACAFAELYPLQVAKADALGIMSHCTSVEMPWVVTNASIEWAGVKVDYNKCTNIVAKIKPESDKLLEFLSTTYGIDNPRSHNSLKEFFQRERLLSRFKTAGGYAFDEEVLKRHRSVHHSIPIILRSRKLLDILSNKILKPTLSGIDGRVHPYHIQLGTDTGRQSCRYPNLAGLGRYLRPVIAPAKGYGIGEVDYSQMEQGVAGAFYGDDKLVDMYNTGDIYSAMVKTFFKDKLSSEDMALDLKEFKVKFSAYRDRMKVCTLGSLYGMTPHGIASELGVDMKEAQDFLRRFMGMFPSLASAIRGQHTLRSNQNFVNMINGLKRYKGKSKYTIRPGQIRTWENNWFVNTPIQGSAAVVFKDAGNRLRQAYKEYGARLIIPVHDSFVFEAPLDQLDVVASLTSEIMCET